MRKRVNTRRIYSRHSYDTNELAELLHVHPQTIRSWRSSGMQPIDPDSHSSLYLGMEVKRYCASVEAKRSVRLADDEYYCFTCHCARKATNVVMVDMRAKMGKDKSSMQRVGNCEKCGRKVCRFFTTPTNVLAEGKGIILDSQPSLYDSITSRKEKYV